MQSIEEVVIAIVDFKRSKAPGHDGVPIEPNNGFHQDEIVSLVNRFNQQLATCVPLPEEWVDSTTVLVPKKVIRGAQVAFKDIRPITKMPTLKKI